tara:strand:+ start:908 stop:1918 length:1011 start_codon:yes stop_codon:yes gene_type:complete
MSIIPIEVPTGAIRYNTDSNKMECFNGTKWWEISVSVTADTGGRGLYAGDQEPGSNSIDYITFSTTGLATDFGDLNFPATLNVGNSSRTRGIFAQGLLAPSDGNPNTLDYVTIATRGNGTDFGDLTQGKFNGASYGNQVRGVWAGGHTPSTVDVMDYVTIASTGNATDFGNLGAVRYAMRGAASATRGMTLGGQEPSGSVSTIEYVTIMVTGNMVDFGDLTSARANSISCSNNIRAVCAAGSTPTIVNTIEFVTIATLGNAQDFGDTENTYVHAGDGATASQTRGFFVDGGAPGTPGGVTTLSQIHLATRGNAYSFGDLTYAAATGCFLSDCHGGL